MAELTSLVIYDSRIFAIGGHVNRWANSVERRFVMNAKQEAPRRSGELRAGISGESFKSGPKHWQVHIHSDAPHSLYVLQGTTGPIMSNRLWGFRQKVPHLRGPRRGMLNPSKPYSTRFDMDWMHSHGYALRVRAGNGFPERFALTVRGQSANNFFGRAATATARRHSSLRGFNPGFNY